MKVSYKKLWKLLIDKDVKKADLRRETGVSSATIAKLTRGDEGDFDIIFNCQGGDDD